jgi:hypothetical protein
MEFEPSALATTKSAYRAGYSVPCLGLKSL